MAIGITHTVPRRKITRAEWAKLQRAFLFGWSLGSIAEATGLSLGTIKAYASRHGWWQLRPKDTEILRKEPTHYEA